jgi:hypothetical protein
VRRRHVAPAGFSDQLANNPNQGRLARNFSGHGAFVALHEAGVVSEHPVVLDFGGGYGLLAQGLKSGGYEVWQVDPYLVLWQPDHQGQVVASWDLQPLGYVQAFDYPIVEDLDPGADSATLSQRGAA